MRYAQHCKLHEVSLVVRTWLQRAYKSPTRTTPNRSRIWCFAKELLNQISKLGMMVKDIDMKISSKGKDIIYLNGHYCISKYQYHRKSRNDRPFFVWIPHAEISTTYKIQWRFISPINSYASDDQARNEQNNFKSRVSMEDCSQINPRRQIATADDTIKRIWKNIY